VSESDEKGILVELDELFDADEMSQVKEMLCKTMAMSVRLVSSPLMRTLYPKMIKMQAKCYRQMFDALITEGFTEDQAVIICAHNNPVPVSDLVFG